MDLERKRFGVRYRVDGFDQEFTRGTYDTREEADWQCRDIASYVGVRAARVITISLTDPLENENAPAST